MKHLLMFNIPIIFPSKGKYNIVNSFNYTLDLTLTNPSQTHTYVSTHVNLMYDVVTSSAVCTCLDAWSCGRTILPSFVHL